MEAKPRKTKGVYAVVLVMTLCAIVAPAFYFHAPEDVWKDQAILGTILPANATSGPDINDTRAGDILSFDSAQSFILKSIKGQTQIRTQVLSLSYKAGNMYLERDIFGHSPQVCLPASGARLIDGPHHHNLTIHGLKTKIEHTIFEHPLEPHPIHIFKLIWLADGKLKSDETENDLQNKGRWASRLALLKDRKNRPPATVIFSAYYHLSEKIDAFQLYQEQLKLYCRKFPPA